ncbi:cancer-related nucleoside-triphosphatase [Garra rufa]|uniref:cancer-related nucleoside-triphosphatase n=1 Tax=Garra rufa TaxID=137080 RepID=UPI003CCECB16
MKHVFLTGVPGVGKTTLVKKVCDAVVSAGVSVSGFYTEEVREQGRRVGFDVVSLTGDRGRLSRVSAQSAAGGRECRVGQYVVDLQSFESLALPLFRDITKENRDVIFDDIVSAVQDCLK